MRSPFLPSSLCRGKIREKGGDFMDPIKRYALDTAKEIVVAKMANATIHASKDSGTQVADFFEEIYKRVLALSKSES